MSIIHITIKGGFDMKKIIISLLIIGSLTTGSVFAYNKNVELNTEEYISLINTNIAELNAEVEPKEKATMGTIFLNGIDEGYIIPSINNDTKLKNCISELVNNIKDTKIFNKKLQNKHNELMTELTDLTELLDNTIKCKKEILNSNDKNLTKGQRLLKEDDKKIKAANKKIEKINNIYKDINNFGVNTKSPIL